MSDGSRISVDVGGSSVRVACGRSSGVIDDLAVERCGVGRSAEQTLAFVADRVRRAGSGVEAVSIGFPGSFDESGAVRIAPNLDPSWKGCRVGAELAARTRTPVFVANDARMAALGEWVFGAGRTLADGDPGVHERMEQGAGGGTMVYLGLGTGIGGGLIIDGRLHLGRGGCAGELGHVVVEMDGPPCACGSRGCVEAIAGGAALIRVGQGLAAAGHAPRLADLLGQGEAPSVRVLARAARGGDVRVEELLQSAYRALGVLVANLAHALSPDLVVFGGGWSRLGDAMLEAIREEARCRLHMVSHEGLRLELSALEDRAGLLGGLALPDRSPTPAIQPGGGDVA